MSKTRSHVGRWRMWSCGQCITSARCHGYREFQLVLLCFIHLFSVNQRTLFFLPSLSLFSESHITGHPAGRVKLYLIKMLSSLPNSSPHIWFSLFVFRGWAMISIQLNQSLLNRQPIWVTFLHVVWYDKAAAAPVRNASSLRAAHRPLCLLVILICTWASWAWFLEFLPHVCEHNCHFPLTLEVAPVHLNHCGIP